MNKRKQRGDSLFEYLFWIAILTAVLGAFTGDDEGPGGATSADIGPMVYEKKDKPFVPEFEKMDSGTFEKDDRFQ